MKAAIDIGSNTLRMVLGDTDGDRIHPVHYLRRITRLGGGYRPECGIAPDAAERTLVALEEFAATLAQAAPERVRAVGTEAIRRSCNAAAFVAMVRQRTGIKLEIIDGEEEARLSASGVLSALAPLPATSLVFDIGGGSTEFILLQGRTCRFHKSYRLGVVALAEGAAPAQIIHGVMVQLQADLDSAGLSELVRAPECELVGTAGSVTTLAAIDMNMTDYDWQRVNNYTLPQASLAAMHQRFLELTPLEREAVPGMEPGRGDLIIYGMEIVLELLKAFQKQQLKVSDFGLLEGVLLSMG